MVRTEQTGGVALVVDEGMPSEQGSVANVVSALAYAVLKPEQMRH